VWLWEVLVLAITFPPNLKAEAMMVSLFPLETENTLKDTFNVRAQRRHLLIPRFAICQGHAVPFPGRDRAGTDYPLGTALGS